MKPQLLFLLCTALLIAPVVSAADPPQNLKSKRYRIGVSVPLSGPAATYGEDVWTSAQFAAEKLGSGDFELLVEDDRCNPRDAVSIAHKFVDVERVDAVIGPSCSGPAAAAAPIYEQSGTLVMLTNASAEKLSEAGDYVFRTKPSDAEIISTLWNYLKDRSAKLGVLSEQTDFALGMRDALLRLSQGGTTSIVDETFLPETSDFRPSLLRLKQAKADGVLIFPQTEAGLALVLRQLREMNWPVQVYGAHFPQSPTFLKLAGRDAEGIIFAATPFPEDILGDEGLKLFQEYKQKHGEMRSIPLLFATTFEGFRALRDSLTSGADARTVLYKTNFNGIFGPYTFDQHGEITGIRYQLKKIENGRVARINP